MAAPGKINLTIYQGATFRNLSTWKAGDPTPTPVDLTGCTARMQIRQTVAASTAYATLTTENGGIILGDDAGTVEIYISDEDTAAYSWTTGFYDLEIEFPSGEVRRLIEGKVTVKPEVTRG